MPGVDLAQFLNVGLNRDVSDVNKLCCVMYMQCKGKGGDRFKKAAPDAGLRQLLASAGIPQEPATSTAKIYVRSGGTRKKRYSCYHHVVSLHIGDCLHYDWVCYTGRHFRLNSLDVRRTPSGRVWSCSNFRSRHLFHPPTGRGGNLVISLLPIYQSRWLPIRTQKTRLHVRRADV